MNPLDFTTCIGLDQEHARELLLAWPTWMAYRPEIYLQPLLLLVDEDMPDTLLAMVESRLAHPNSMIHRVRNKPSLNQRDKMLSALTLEAPFLVNTPVLFKVDTDAVATRYDPAWCQESLLADGQVFASHPWGYTKPPDALEVLDDWGDGVPELQVHPRLNIPVSPNADCVLCPRIQSFVFFGQTAWLQKTAILAGNQLPVPSQDTFVWYVAHRRKEPYNRVNMKMLGWEHIHPSRLEGFVAQLTMQNKHRLFPHQHSLLHLLQGRGGMVGCEIGVSRAETSAYLLSNLGNLRLHLVDSWASHGQNTAYWQSGDQHARLGQDGQREHFLAAIRNVAFAWDRVQIHRNDSTVAAARFPDESLDWVFIDGDHTYEAVKADLATWFPKVKKGGIFSGHDYRAEGKYRHQGVRQAVNEWMTANNRKVNTARGSVWWIEK